MFIKVLSDQTVLSSSPPSPDRTVAYAYVTHTKKKARLSLSSPVHLQKSRYRFPKTHTLLKALHLSELIIIVNINRRNFQKMQDLFCLTLLHMNSKWRRCLIGCIWCQALISESHTGQHLPFPPSEPSERASVRSRLENSAVAHAVLLSASKFRRSPASVSEIPPHSQFC